MAYNYKTAEKNYLRWSRSSDRVNTIGLTLWTFVTSY